MRINDKILDIVNRFLDEAEKYDIHILQAILFGSYAKGTNTEYSDIDLAIVSSDFVGTRYLDNQKIRRAKLNVSYELETHPFSPEDFDEENPFVKEILTTGVKIK